MYNDIITSLKFYNHPDKQLFRRSNIYVNLLISPTDKPLPFQIKMGGDSEPISSIQLYTLKDELIDGDLLQHFSEISKINLSDGSGYVVNKDASFDNNYVMPKGRFYFRINIGAQSFYSELFQAKGTESELSNCYYKLVYGSCSTTNDVYNTTELGYYDYLYIDSDLGDPKYLKAFKENTNLFEEVSRSKSVFIKSYLFELVLHEHVMDIIQIAPTFSDKLLYTPTGDIVKIVSVDTNDPKWEGFAGEVTVEMIVKKHVKTLNCENEATEVVGEQEPVTFDQVTGFIVAESEHFYRGRYWHKVGDNVVEGGFITNQIAFIYDDESRVTGKRYRIAFGNKKGWKRYIPLPDPVEKQVVKDNFTGKFWLYVGAPHDTWGKKPQIKSISRDPNGFVTIEGITFEGTFQRVFSNNNNNLSNMNDAVSGAANSSSAHLHLNGITYGIVTYDSETHFFEAFINDTSYGFSDPF